MIQTTQLSISLIYMLLRHKPFEDWHVFKSVEQILENLHHQIEKGFLAAFAKEQEYIQFSARILAVIDFAVEKSLA